MSSSLRSHRSGPAGSRSTNDLIGRWQQHGDRRARDEVFDRFLPLARRLAGRYSNPHEPTEDLVQVASLGLLAAIDRFDPARGTHFSSFAIPTMLGELKRYFRNTGWSVHVNRGAQELALRVGRAARELTAQTGQSPRVGALAEYLEISAEDVLVGLDARYAHYAASLDAPAAGAESDELQTLGDSLGDQDDRFGLIETALSLRTAIAQLPYMERQAVSLRINSDMKQAEIAERLGCSQMQVSRLLRRARQTVHELMGPALS